MDQCYLPGPHPPAATTPPNPTPAQSRSPQPDTGRPTASAFRLALSRLVRQGDTGGRATTLPTRKGEIVAAVDVGQSTVSAHLKVLAEVRFVLAGRRGTSTYYRINEACVDCFPTAADVVMGRPLQPSRSAPAQ